MSVGAEPAIRIFLTCSGSFHRRAVRRALDSIPGLAVVGEAQSAREAVEGVRRLDPDIALLDADMLATELAAVIREVIQHAADTKVIVLSSDVDHTLLCDTLKTGAAGLVSKKAALSDLADAARTVQRGGRAIPVDMMGALIDQLLHEQTKHSKALRRLATLTRQELVVLRLLSDGATTKMIGEILTISEKTARTHVQRILRKLKLHSRLEAVAFVNRHDLTGELVAATG